MGDGRRFTVVVNRKVVMMKLTWKQAVRLASWYQGATGVRAIVGVWP